MSLNSTFKNANGEEVQKHILQNTKLSTIAQGSLKYGLGLFTVHSGNIGAVSTMKTTNAVNLNQEPRRLR